VGCAVIVDGLQIELAGASYNGIYLSDTTTSNPETILFENLILRATVTINYAMIGGSSSQGHADRSFTLRNSVVYGASGNGGDTSTGTHVYAGLGNFTLHNVTIYGTGTGGNGVMNRHAYTTAINVIARGNASGYAFHQHTTGSGEYNAATDYNSGEDASATDINSTKTSGSPWNSSADADSDYFLDASSSDFRIGAGDLQLDVGYDLSGTFDYDAIGTSRPQNSVFDLGWLELIVAADADPTEMQGSGSFTFN
ncbi:MAG: hypothetical protein V3S69_07580, partial [Dehalococcoidales bacterium]